MTTINEVVADMIRTAGFEAMARDVESSAVDAARTVRFLLNSRGVMGVTKEQRPAFERALVLLEGKSAHFSV